MQHLQKTGGWEALPFDVLTPIPANVSNVFPIYPLYFHTLVALTGSTALEQLFSNQPVTHSFRRDGGILPPPVLSLSFPAPSLDRNESPVTSHQSRVTSHESPVTSHGSHPPVHNGTVAYTLPHVYCPLRSSPPFVRGIARCRCLGGRHEQNFEDCSHRRRRAGRPCSRRAVFDSR